MASPSPFVHGEKCWFIDDNGCLQSGLFVDTMQINGTEHVVILVEPENENPRFERIPGFLVVQNEPKSIGFWSNSDEDRALSGL